MNELFGIPMSSILNVLVAILALCLLSVAWVAWRRPIIFKLGVRNIPRRRAQTTLIVVGLMLSTLIISAALGTGDTLHHSLTKDSYNSLGQVDQLVVPSTAHVAPNIDTTTKFSDSTLAVVDGALAGNADVDGIIPVLDAPVSVINETSQQAEPAINLLGVDPARIADFGGLRSTDGANVDLAGIGTDGVVLSESAADALDAEAGDKVTVFYQGAPHDLTVAAVAEDTYLSGYRRGRETGVELPGMVMPLATVQAMTSQFGQLTAIAISGSGGVRDGFKHTDAVVESLRSPLAGTGLGVDAVKRFSVDDGETLASTFTAIFLVLGLFSVAAGSLLIVLIFSMLAAERRSEMGMARAVGTHRKQLIQQFVAEGSGYALLAGVVGSALGVGASIGIANAMKFLFGQYVPIEPHVEPRSMIVAYCLGVILTFVTVVVSSWKVSKLNVVAAIRDIPEVGTGKRSVKGLAWGIVLLAAGGFLTLAGQSGNTAALFFMGMSLMPFGLTLIARFFGAPNRPILSAVGIYILALWLLPENVGNRIWGELDGDVEMLFLSGIFMVIGATILTMQNTNVLLAGITRIGSRFSGILPAVRTAVAYPAAARGRTGMTIAMFSLIIFSLVIIATTWVNFSPGEDANGGWDIRADIHGQTAALTLADDIQAAGVDTSDYQATGVTTNPSPYSSAIRLGGTDDWKQWPVIGMDTAFIDNSTLFFQQRAEGYGTDAEVIAALKADPSLAVINAWALPMGMGGNDSNFALTGMTSGDKIFTPVSVELAGPDGSVTPVTIIGIIDEKIYSHYGLFMGQETVDATYPILTSTSLYIALKDENLSDTSAKAIEAALLQQVVQTTSIHDVIKDAEKEQSGFLYLIEGFMGLGLLVGVAAVGVIAFRSVVERRQQIGVLRALGFQRSQVSLSFLIETGFIVGIGAITGTVLGVALTRNLLASGNMGSPVEHFQVPWVLITTIVVSTVIAALSMTWLPSRQAGRIAPAEALRYE